MAKPSVRVEVLRGVMGVDCPYCMLDRRMGHSLECTHFMVPFVTEGPPGKFYAVIEMNDGQPQIQKGPFASFDEAAAVANAGCATFTAKVGGVVRCKVPTLAEGGKLLEAVRCD